MILGIFGAALLYGDGMITPAISVLSAVEGMKLITPALDAYVIPVTVFILFLLFLFQSGGSRVIGSFFGPMMAIWFVVLAALGIAGIVIRPDVLAAINPVYAVKFFIANGWLGALILGAVFLVVTGGEALYADIGHFGRRPVRLAWFGLVFPALLANYFGQGALLLNDASAASQPFYLLSPRWGFYPLLLLATMATVIASQAIISGVFSLTRQAVLLGYLPRLRIVQTSSEEVGQIYISSMNWLLLAATIILVISFKESINLAAAYGVAVSTTMVITTILIYPVTRRRWKWSRTLAIFVTALFLIVDVSFFSVNITRIKQGGWVPLLIGGAVFVVMTTWNRGREILHRAFERYPQSLNQFVRNIATDAPIRVSGTAVFMTEHYRATPLILAHHYKHNKTLHEQVFVVTVIIDEVPRVRADDRLDVIELGQGFTRVVIRYGFMQTPNVPRALKQLERHGLELDLKKTTFFVGRSHPVMLDESRRMASWRKKLFAFMSRNGADPISFYHLPPECVLEMGIQVRFDKSGKH